MTTGTPIAGPGLGRVIHDGRPAVVLYGPGSGEARIAGTRVGAVADLPELLDTTGGDFASIIPGETLAVAEEALLSPLARPRKIIGVGQNYIAHVHEGGRAAGPEYPDLFAKWDNALSAPYADIPLPPESEQIDFESELAVVIGRRARRIRADQAEDVVFGYTCANDGSVRDFQFHTSQRTAGKAWDRLTPLGPVVVPASRLGGVRPDLRIQGLLNGEVVQDDRTSSLIFGVPELIAYITTFMTLEPGDVILTGTPAGVGAVRKPPLWLTHGTEFEVRIEGIGSLRNRFSKEQAT